MPPCQMLMLQLPPERLPMEHPVLGVFLLEQFLTGTSPPVLCAVELRQM